MHFPHELKDEFPGEGPLIEQLAKNSHDFARLVTSYGEINRHIYDIESEDEPTSDEVLEKLKKRRLELKDEIAEILRKTERRF